MKITFVETIPHTVEISEEKAKEISIKTLYSLIGFQDAFIEDFIEESYLCTWDDTGHGSGITDRHRVATDLDKSIIKVIKELKKMNRILFWIKVFSMNN